MASLTNYQKGDYAYPSDHTNPDLKEEKTFIKQYAEAFYADFSQNRCLVPYFLNKSSFIAEARAYSTGTQSEDKIKSSLCKKNDKGQFVSKMNISWRNVDIMSNIFDTIRSINQGVSFDTSVTCIDPETVEIKQAEQEFVKFLMDKSTQEFLERTGFQPKMAINPEEIGLKSKRDAELFFQAGGMMLMEEIAAVACVDKAKLISAFQVIQDKWNDDLTQIGFTGGKNEINRVTGDAYPRYVEPALAAIPWSKFRDFRDITRAGELRFMTLAEVARENPALSDADLDKIANEFADIGSEYEMWAHAGGIVPTPAMSSAGRGAGAGTPREFLKVPVFDFQFLSHNTYKHVENTRKSGKFFTKEVGYGHELSKEQKKTGDTMYHEQRVCKYFGKWIVGTDYFIDCGKAKNQNYIEKGLGMVPSLDYFFVQTGNKSIVARCIEHIDMINLLDKKLQNALISLPPAPRMLIKKQVLENVVVNGKVQSQDDFINTLAEKGIGVYNDLDPFNRPLNSNSRPVEPLNISVVEDINMFSQLMLERINMIKMITGVNDALMGNVEQERVGLGRTKLAIAQGSKALSPIFNAMKVLYENIFGDIISKYQMIAANMEKDIAVAPLGITNMQVLKLGDKFASARFNLKVEMTSNEEENMLFVQEVMQLKQARVSNGGTGGITAAQALMLLRAAKTGNLQYAQLQLAKYEADQAQKDQENKERDIQMTGQLQQQSAMVTAEEQRKTMNAEVAAKQKLSMMEKALDRKLEITKAYLATPKEGEQKMSDAVYRALIAECDSDIQMAIMAANMASEPQQQPEGVQEGMA